jgi:hypothetical protein
MYDDLDLAIKKYEFFLKKTSFYVFGYIIKLDTKLNYFQI